MGAGAAAPAAAATSKRGAHPHPRSDLIGDGGEEASWNGMRDGIRMQHPHWHATAPGIDPTPHRRAPSPAKTTIRSMAWPRAGRPGGCARRPRTSRARFRHWAAPGHWWPLWAGRRVAVRPRDGQAGALGLCCQGAQGRSQQHEVADAGEVFSRRGPPSTAGTARGFALVSDPGSHGRHLGGASRRGPRGMRPSASAG